MNQTFLYSMSSVGVGLFHKSFPPINSIGINPNPTHGNLREMEANPFRNISSCASSRRIPSLLSSSLVYKSLSRGEFLKSCNLLAASSPPTPADNYNNIFIESQNYNKSYIESYKKSVTFGSMAVHQFGC